MFKKVLALTLLLVTTLYFTACPSGDGLLSAEEIIEKAVQAMDDVKTYQFELNMSMNMVSEAEDKTYEETIAMDYNGTFDIENGEMMLDISASVAMFAGGMEMSGAMYIIDGMAYTMIEDLELGSVWEKADMSGEYWEEMSQVKPQIEMLQAVQVEVVGSEEVKGVDCYILNFTPDIGQLLQLAMERALLSGEELNLLDMGKQVELYKDAFKDYSIKQWIAKDTYLVARAEMNISMVYPDEESSMTMETAMDLLVYNYNQPVSIVLPAGAEEAIEALE